MGSDLVKRLQTRIPVKPIKVKSKESMENVYYLATLYGVNFPKGRHKALVLLSLFIFVTGTFYFPLSFAISFVRFRTTKGVRISIVDLLRSIMVAFNVFGGGIKVMIMYVMLKRLRAGDPYMDQLDARLQSAEECMVLPKVIRLCRKVPFLHLFAYCIYATSTLIAAIIGGKPLYSLYFPYVKWERSWVECIFIVAAEYYLVMTACLQQSVNDSYPFIYVKIVAAHIKVLIIRLQRLGIRSDMSDVENLQELKLCILDHQNILGLFNVFTPIAAITLFIQFMLTAVMISVTLISLFIFKSDSATVFASIFYIVIVLIQVYPICYSVQDLIDINTNLAVQIFHSEWTEKDYRFQKMLIFFMQMAQRPLEMTAGKLFPINLNMFISMMKFAFSLYTFVKRMGIKEKFGN